MIEPTEQHSWAKEVCIELSLFGWRKDEPKQPPHNFIQPKYEDNDEVKYIFHLQYFSMVNAIFSKRRAGKRQHHATVNPVSFKHSPPNILIMLIIE